ncbi:hypothetical protein [Agrobacterium tumefaciens]|nr:hypothetical protein [Agrobacterium tumefaciens]WCK68807.1 hypothetical protein G6L23_025705 [Agrobacterium tumefaciens]
MILEAALERPIKIGTLSVIFPDGTAKVLRNGRRASGINGDLTQKA